MKIKSYYKHMVLAIVNRLNDVRFVGQLLFLVIVLLISWSGVKVIQTNYSLQKQISVLKQQNKLQQLQNENLALQNQYYNSNQYLELSARQNFGLAAPGEKEIIVPRQVALGLHGQLTHHDRQQQFLLNQNSLLIRVILSLGLTSSCIAQHNDLAMLNGCFDISTSVCYTNNSIRRGVEQRQLAWLITTRSQVRVLPPQP